MLICSEAHSITFGIATTIFVTASPMLLLLLLLLCRAS
jgi:hypothetical protein